MICWTKIWKLASFTIADFCDVHIINQMKYGLFLLMVYVLFGALLFHITETSNLWLKKRSFIFFLSYKQKKMFQVIHLNRKTLKYVPILISLLANFVLFLFKIDWWFPQWPNASVSNISLGWVMIEVFRAEHAHMLSLYTKEKTFVNITWRPTRILWLKHPLERSLDKGHSGAAQNSTFRTNLIAFLLNPWNHCKILGKSLVIILQMRFFPNSSRLSSSEKKKNEKAVRIMATQYLSTQYLETNWCVILTGKII